MLLAPLPPPPSEVFLPPLWQRPAFDDILDCLKKLRIEPPIWSPRLSRADILKEQQESAANTAHHRREILSFLSFIIKSSLAWIEDDDRREELWEEASKRLSERCGRAAMGEIIRRWPFPDHHQQHGANSPFSLSIREPPITGDALGLKTWGSSYVLAQLLRQFASTTTTPAGPLSHLFPAHQQQPPEVLELGSGTGLLGLAAACIWKTTVVLTDLDMIMPNLRHNAELNRATVEACGGRVDTAALTWGAEPEENDPRFAEGNQYKLILAADAVYDDNHPVLLASATNAHLSLCPDARALAMIPMRDETTDRLLAIFKSEMLGQKSSGDGGPLFCVAESLVSGQDDWGAEDDEESRHVGFWWGVFARREGEDSVK
ncbi:putative methyltransferase-domain-containing protein [Bombardia bombarda]|uniref:Methyltransferase-domain-containing protein n=1 Tax=Bombardia bombarda TaxID=252184 RepID=A0AA40BY14_9PEZI|nr:putative methyltransferase-domain-containing protein [Bombardia bombarda]